MDKQERLQRRRNVAIGLAGLVWLGVGGLFALWHPLALAIYGLVSVGALAILLAVDWDRM